MDSVLCLHHGALRIPSTTSRAAGLVRPYSSFRPSSLTLVSKMSTYRTLAQRSFTRPLICALNNPSQPSPNYDKDNRKHIVRVVGGASVVLACILGVINCNYNFRTTAIAGTRASTPQGGDTLVLSKPKGVLDSLLKLNRPLPPPTHKWFRSTSKLKIELPEIPSPKLEITELREKLQEEVARLIQSGNCDEAERQLTELYSKAKGGEIANEVEMVLVPVLIFQGKYPEALKRNCLGGAAIRSDGRVQFYKAIIHTMLGEDDEAVKCWNNFISSFST